MTVTGPDPSLGINGDNFLEKLISKLRYEGLVRIVRGKDRGGECSQKRNTIYKGLEPRGKNNLGRTSTLLRWSASGKCEKRLKISAGA